MKSKLALLTITLIFSGQIWGKTAFKEGVHYHLIQNSEKQQTDESSIQVKEFFWYGCHTCYALQPYFEHWIKTKANHLKFERIAAMTHDNMELLARSYYTAIKLNLSKQIHIPLFTAIHGHKTKIKNQTQLHAFLKKQKIDSKLFIQTMQSPEITKQIKRARQLGENLEIAGPPTMTIGGRYRIDPSGVGSASEFIDVLDFLVDKTQRKSEKQLYFPARTK